MRALQEVAHKHGGKIAKEVAAGRIVPASLLEVMGKGRNKAGDTLSKAPQDAAQITSAEIAAPLSPAGSEAPGALAPDRCEVNTPARAAVDPEAPAGITFGDAAKAVGRGFLQRGKDLVETIARHPIASAAVVLGVSAAVVAAPALAGGTIVILAAAGMATAIARIAGGAVTFARFNGKDRGKALNGLEAAGGGIFDFGLAYLPASRTWKFARMSVLERAALPDRAIGSQVAFAVKEIGLDSLVLSKSK